MLVFCRMHRNFPRRCLTIAARAVVLVLLTTAARPVAAAEPGEDLTVYALTFGPGDHPFFKFGHNAILIQPRDGTGLVFNFGTFQFDSPGLIPKFLRGRLNYWLSVSPAAETLESYQASNRTIIAQELDLSPAQRQALWTRLRENARPQNREYLYDYFWDNCSTRVRDALDAVVDGRIKASGQGPASQSMRAHALRLTADLPWEYVGLHLGLGSLTDAPATQWQEAFLPEELARLLRNTRLFSDGAERPLVKAERVLFAANRPPPLARPPRWTSSFALVGIVLGGALALNGLRVRRGSSSLWPRLMLAVGTGLFGLVLGLLGLILLALWGFTNHKAAHANANILQCAPWAVALVVLAVGVARGRPRATRLAFSLAASAALLSAIGLLAKLLPGTPQDNASFIALFLPIWIGMALGLGQAAAAVRVP
jgi:hypothetical protein